MQYSDDNEGVTLINVYTVDPAHQQRLVDLLGEMTESVICHARGFISASLHRSVDGRKVTWYARWRSIEDYQVLRQTPASQRVLEDALSFATFEPGVYTTAGIFRSAR